MVGTEERDKHTFDLAEAGKLVCSDSEERNEIINTKAGKIW